MAADRANAVGGAEELDDVVLAYLEAVEAGQSPDRAAWLARYPHLARELGAFFADQDQFSHLVAPISVNTPPPSRNRADTAPSETRPPLAPGSVVGDHELIEEIASGGMGVVYKARHRTLGRIVALKMIRAGNIALPEDVARFRLEAEAAALLDHPNIVPIYDVGQHEDQPYFSMKLIDGGNLAQSPPASRGTLVEIMVQVARAVHYAHERGILHRDLKPANILLDRRGQPHVTDFGLAKRLPAGSGVESPTSLTQKGIAVGTPGYMAPEQARGPKNRVTVAVDVYSLGAVLYALLTGRPPFKADTPLETLVQLMECQPVSPRSLVSSVPRDLDTICLKCLEKDPSQRYASAEALADDLQRFLDGEPIQARPASLVERFVRWCRRSPVVAGLTAALLLTFITGLVAVTYLWQRAERHWREAEHERKQVEQEQQNTKEALLEVEFQRQVAKHESTRAAAAVVQIDSERKRTDEQRKLADENARKARDFADFISTRLSDPRLSSIPGLQPLRKEFLELGVKYYRDFLDQRADDPALKADLAKAQFRLASLTSQIGRKSDALASYAQALKTYEELLAADPDNAVFREQIARTCINRGAILEAVNDKKAALASYERARDLLEEMDRAHPSQVQILSHLGVLYNNLGNVNRGLNQLDESRKAYDRCREVLQRHIKADPLDLNPQRDLAVLNVNVAILYATRGDKDEAMRWHVKAREVQEQLHKDHPNDRDVQRDLALTYRRIGERLVRDGEIEKGKTSLQQGHELIEKLADANKNILEYQWELALSHRALGHAYKAAKDRVQAIEAYRKATNFLSEAHRRDPSAAIFSRDLASTLFDLGLILSGDAADIDEALRAYGDAADLYRDLAKGGADADALADLGACCNNMGHLWRERRHPREALTAFDHCREAREALVQLRPGDTRAWNDLAATWFNVAQMQGALKRPDDCIRAYERSRDIRERLVKENPHNVGLQYDLGTSLVNLGNAYAQAERIAESLATLRRAVEQKRIAFGAMPENSDYRRGLNIAYGALAEVERKKGKPSASAVALLERRKLWPNDPQELYRIARELAQTAVAVSRDKKSLSTEDQAELTRCLNETLATLRQAVAAGFNDAERLAQEADFAPLRNREEFKKLLPAEKK